MLFRWTDSPNADLLHRQRAIQLADTFLSITFGSPLMDPCTTKEASSLYGLCLKACVENSLLCSSYQYSSQMPGITRVSTRDGGTSVRHICNRKFKTVFQNGLSMSVVTLQRPVIVAWEGRSHSSVCLCQFEISETSKSR